MAKIKITAEEIILWLRKNGYSKNVTNLNLGKKIAKFIGSENYSEKDTPSFWLNEVCQKILPQIEKSCPYLKNLEDIFKIAITDWNRDHQDDEIGVPLTSQEYLINTNELPSLFEKLIQL